MAGLLKTVVSDAGQAAHMLGDLSLDPVCLMLMAASADCALRAVAFRAQVRSKTGAWRRHARPAGALRRLDGSRGGNAPRHVVGYSTRRASLAAPSGPAAPAQLAERNHGAGAPGRVQRAGA
jgi:hypothetical protein